MSAVKGERLHLVPNYSRTHVLYTRPLTYFWIFPHTWMAVEDINRQNGHCSCILEVMSHLLACFITQNNHPTLYIAHIQQRRQ